MVISSWRMEALNLGSSNVMSKVAGEKWKETYEVKFRSRGVLLGGLLRGKWNVRISVSAMTVETPTRTKRYKALMKCIIAELGRS
jgi:hypothetical protein